MSGLLGDLAALASGLSVTARYAVENWTGDGAITVRYPEEAAPVAPRFRGHLFNAVERCIVCMACAKACPVDCFTIVGEPADGGKGRRAARFDIDLATCIWCGLCVRACPTDCLSFTRDYQVAPERHGAGPGFRYLFRVSPAQMERVLTTAETARLRGLGLRPAAELAEDDRRFLGTLEDPDGTGLLGRYGLGFRTPEERAALEAARAAAPVRPPAQPPDASGGKA